MSVVDIPPLGIVPPDGLFRDTARGPHRYVITFAHDALSIPPGMVIDMGDYIGFVSPANVTYSARIAGLGSCSHSDGRPRSTMVILDGEGEHLDEVRPGWLVVAGSWKGEG